MGEGGEDGPGTRSPWGCLLLALAAVSGLSGCRYEEREVEIGYLGEARRNPFLAAERLCEEYGVSAETRLSISDLPNHGTTLVLAGDVVRSGGSAELIANWVEEGGSVIYFVQGGSRFRNDFEGGVAIMPEEAREETDYFLDYMEVTTTASGESNSTIVFGEERFEVDLPGSTVFEAEWATPYNGFGEDPGPVFEFSYGSGVVYLVADAHPFRNRQIGEKDHAALFWTLVDACGNGSVMFVVGGRISFLGLLWSRGWMVVVPVLLAVAFWLWKSAPRHGPTLPDETVSKRDFARHVDALGHFLWRHRAPEHLLAPVRRRVQMRLQAAPAGQDGEQAEHRRWESLAERSGLTIDRVRQAMSSDPGKEPARFVQISRDLHTIENSL